MHETGKRYRKLKYTTDGKRCATIQSFIWQGSEESLKIEEVYFFTV